MTCPLCRAPTARTADDPPLYRCERGHVTNYCLRGAGRLVFPHPVEQAAGD